VALGAAYLFPPLSFGGASLAGPSLRFHILLIEPGMQNYRTGLSDKTHAFAHERSAAGPPPTTRGRATPAQRLGARFAHFPSRVSLPKMGVPVGLRIVLFEDCSAFTRVTACTLAKSPNVTLYTGGSSHFVTSMTAPIASGWSESCRVGFSPTGKTPPFTAHTHSGHLRVPLTSSISPRILRPCAPSNNARTQRRSMRRLDAYLSRYILHSFKAKNVAITTQKLMIAEAMKPLILISQLI